MRGDEGWAPHGLFGSRLMEWQETEEGRKGNNPVLPSGRPNFEVLIRLPRFVTEKDEKIPVDVCGL